MTEPELEMPFYVVGARIVRDIAESAEHHDTVTAKAALWGASITFAAMIHPQQFMDSVAAIDDDDDDGMKPIAQWGLNFALHITELAEDLEGIINMIRTMPEGEQATHLATVGAFLKTQADAENVTHVEQHRLLRNLAEQVAAAALISQTQEQ